VERSLSAAETARVDTLFVSGGVACNSLLRERIVEVARERRMKAFFPSPALSTDNAAMVAAAGYFRLASGERADTSLTAHASLPFG
jgi:N6-L-threonylcarbamoyladenine synthase